MFNSIPDPVAFSLFGYDVRWYGVLISFGILVAMALIYFRAPKYNIKKEYTLDMFLCAIPFGIIGARFYYVIFSWENYSDDLFQIFMISEGGLAIHGALILGGLALFLLCRYRKIHFFSCLDLFAPAVVLAQSIGRWGNYFNMEAHGGPTDLPWAILINGEWVHPTFLYESIWCFVLFVFLIIYENKRKFTGQIFLLYCMLYSLERFFVEGLRTDSLMLGPFRQAQIFSLSIIIFSLLMYVYLYKKQIKTQNENQDNFTSKQ